MIYSITDWMEKIAAVVAVSDRRILFPKETDIHEDKEEMVLRSFSEKPPAGPIMTAHFLNFFVSLIYAL